MAWTISFALTWPMGSILISMGRIWFALTVGALSSAINLGLSAWLIPIMGASGMALAAFVGMLAACIPCLALLYRELPDLMRLMHWWTMLGVTTVLVSACVFASQYLAPLPACGVGIVCSLLFLLWRLHPQTNRLA